mmetsp:Transcript_25545/g.76104  ORF Transcript_25545/g.76104 Transcript_25545/m.76104 type:complete len:245 (-) Transcript_25545:368-1102(-)
MSRMMKMMKPLSRCKRGGECRKKKCPVRCVSAAWRRRQAAQGRGQCRSLPAARFGLLLLHLRLRRCLCCCTALSSCLAPVLLEHGHLSPHRAHLPVGHRRRSPLLLILPRSVDRPIAARRQRGHRGVQTGPLGPTSDSTLCGLRITGAAVRLLGARAAAALAASRGPAAVLLASGATPSSAAGAACGNRMPVCGTRGTLGSVRTAAAASALASSTIAAGHRAAARLRASRSPKRGLDQRQGGKG